MRGVGEGKMPQHVDESSRYIGVTQSGLPWRTQVGGSFYDSRQALKPMNDTAPFHVIGGIPPVGGFEDVLIVLLSS